LLISLTAQGLLASQVVMMHTVNSDAHRDAMLQRISQEMDGMWRMQVVRENSAKRDVWKR
jgi:predicted acetyltransferase